MLPNLLSAPRPQRRPPGEMARSFRERFAALSSSFSACPTVELQVQAVNGGSSGSGHWAEVR